MCQIMKRTLVHFFKGINCLSVFLLLLICLIPIVYIIRRRLFAESHNLLSFVHTSCVLSFGMYQEEMAVCSCVKLPNDGFVFRDYYGGAI